MQSLMKLILIIIVSILFLIPVSMIVTDGGYDTTGAAGPGKLEDDQARSTRGASSARANYEIKSSTSIKMPQVDGSWNQSDWSGGPGQDEWSDNSKFDYSSNLNYSAVDGHLELGMGSTIQAWMRYSDSNIDRERHRMVYAPSKKVFYLYGGQVGQNTVTDRLYEYNPNTDSWRQIGSSGAPSGRCSNILVWDNVSDLLWIYGGRTADWGNRFRDLWKYDPASDSWTQMAQGPPGRCDSAGAFNPLAQHIIIWGGYDGSFNNPSHEVWIYNVTTNSWWQQNNHTRRYYHDAIWSPETNTVLFYGGASAWTQGSGYTYVNEFNEYFPETDTWGLRTPKTNRVRPLLGWDTLNKKVILHGGSDGDTRGYVHYYNLDTDTWSQYPSLVSERDYCDGDWDSENNQFVIQGGRRGWSRLDDVWAYLPNITGFAESGDLYSSVYNPGHRFNLKSVLFNISKPYVPGLDTKPVKIKVAGSTTSADDVTNFIGPTGSNLSYFFVEEGQNAPPAMTGIRYLAYHVNLSTENAVYTPELNWVRIDYYTYPESYSWESVKTQLPETKGLPLRFVNWTGNTPEGTSIKVYFRQSFSDTILDTLSWEEVVRGQTTFTYNAGTWFQYKVTLATTEPGYTPELTSIRFVFNQLPAKPTPLSPANNTWIGDPTPALGWTFNDPDTSDFQGALEINIALEDSFEQMAYTSNKVQRTNNSFEITLNLNDGTYYWRVKTWDNYGSESPWSDMFVLKIDTKKPDAPKVETFTHAFEHLWYSNNWPHFHWNEPVDVSGINGYSYVLDQSPFTDPDQTIMMTDEEYRLKYNATEFKGLVSFNDVKDGIWYFHVRAVDSLGSWSDTATRKIQIDKSPPQVTDLTPENVTAGSTFDFRFELNDTHSGVDLTTIYYKYESQESFQKDVLSSEENDKYSFTHALRVTSDSYIEYYIEVLDAAEPVNTLRYPTSGEARINILDVQPPVIKDVTGNKEHNRYINLEITVEATDNVGVKEAKVYFNDQVSGKLMTDKGSGVFTLTIDRVELLNMAGYAGENMIIYNVRVWDFHNNSARAPASGNFNITLLDIDEEEPEEEEEKEEGGLSQAFLINIIILVVVIVIVGIVLFIFIRKQGEKMDEDRHALRMAIADVEEAAGTKLPPTDVVDYQPMEGFEPLPSLTGAPAAPGAPGYAAPQPLPPPGQPIPDTQAVPAGYLPQAPAEPPAPDQDFLAYKQPGTTSATEPPSQPQVQPQPEITPEPQAGPGPATESVNIDDGFSVSLPEETTNGKTETPEGKKTDIDDGQS